MYNEDNIRNEIFIIYNNLIDTVKRRSAKNKLEESIERINELLKLVPFNEDELHIIRNIILIIRGIIENSPACYKKNEEVYQKCKELFIKIYDVYNENNQIFNITNSYNDSSIKTNNKKKN